MMSFRLNPSSRILGAEPLALRILRTGFIERASITATQDPTKPIILNDEPQQWLRCQTSGSSGAPKTIRRNPQSWINSFEITADLFDVTHKDNYAVFGGLAHSLTLYACCEALHLGADICMLDGMSPKSQAANLLSQQITVIYATPTQLRLLAKLGNEFSMIKHVFIGGGVLDASLWSALPAIFPSAQIRQFFGSSETSFITITDTLTPVGSVGKAYPDVDLQVRDQNVDGVGEIWVRSAYVFDGYEGSPDGAQWDGGYLSIGELGALDDHGYLFLHGRKTRMVTVMDQNVFLDAVETVVRQCTGVTDCAVVAVADAARGHRIVCYVAGDLTLDDIGRHCRAKLAAHAVPKEIHILMQIPVLPAGKPDLARLVRKAEQ